MWQSTFSVVKAAIDVNLTVFSCWLLVQLLVWRVCVLPFFFWAMMTSVGMVGVCSALFLLGHDDQYWYGGCVFCPFSFGP